MDVTLIVRLWVSGSVVDQTVVGRDDAGDTAERHVALATAAEERGQSWMVEVDDPDVGMTFGTDERAQMRGSVGELAALEEWLREAR